MVRASARVAKQDKEADEKNRSYFADVERKFKRTRSRHLESLESSNFGYQRSKAEEIIAQTGGGEQDGAAEVVGKKAKKTRTGRQQLATSKKPLGQILHETVLAVYQFYCSAMSHRTSAHPALSFTLLCSRSSRN